MTTPDFDVLLTPARWFVTVMAGAAGGAALIALGLAAAAMFPALTEHQVGSIELLLTIAAMAALVLGCARLARGPRLRLACRGGRLELRRQRSGDLIAEADEGDLALTPATTRAGPMALAALRLTFPGRRPLALATLDPRPRLGAPVEVFEATHTLEPLAFVKVIDRLCPEAWEGGERPKPVA